MAHQLQQLRNRQKTMHGTTNLTKHVSKEALLRPDVFVVITARCIWPIFSFWQQKQLCELAKEFCYTELGVHGPLIHVYGDVLPPSDFLLIVPRTREVPDMIRAASDFIRACHKLWALSVQLQLGQLAVLNTSDPQLSLQRIKPNSCPHIAAWRRINMSHRPVSVQLLAELSSKDATVFALVTDAASQTTAKSMSVSTGEALSPILDEVEKRMYITAGTLAEEYTDGGVVTLAHDEMVLMLLLQAEVATEAGRVVNLYSVISSM